MDWYYVRGQERVGPLDDAVFHRLVDEGAVSPETLVWNSTLADWLPYGRVAEGATESADTNAAAMGECVECGTRHPLDTMLTFEGVTLCYACKDPYFQRVLQGTPRSLGAEYGGFWRRFAAKIIDLFLFGALFVPLQTMATLALPEHPFVFMAINGLVGLLSFAAQVTYETYFVGSRGATLGKMALGLKVVVADGSRVSYARACGRAFAEIVSGIILYVGYIMAAFDPERRTLHDHMCNTRVIRT